MHKLFIFIVIALLTFGLMFCDASAKRFGGSKSFGFQRSSSNFSQYPYSKTPFSNPVKSNSLASKVLPALGGFALGGLLASLFMGHGLGSGLLSWILIIGGIILLWRLLRIRTPQPLSSINNNQDSSFNRGTPFSINPSNSYQSYSAAPTSTNYPKGFEPEIFLREAKVTFMRMQAAYDSKNLADIGRFTAPEVFAEIQMQLQERSVQVNQTEVISLDGQLQEITTEGMTITASVRFFGAIREHPKADEEAFSEIWHFQKDNQQSQWLVAGIQQV